MENKETIESTAIDYDLLVRVAEQYYLLNRTQVEIARDIGVSRSSISRLLAKAREEQIVRIQIAQPHVRSAALESALVNSFSLDEAIVIQAPSGVLTDEERRRLVASLAAPFVDEMIKPGAVVGMGRGRTLAELVMALQPYGTPRNITIVQLLGEVNVEYSAANATEITRIMADRYSGTSYYLTAPALVEDIHLFEGLMKSPNIARLIKMYDTLDLAILGIGSLHHSPLVIGGLLRDTHIQKLEKAGAVGDICGHFFNTQKSLVTEAYAGKAIGISWEQLKKIPRVIAIACGEDKSVTLRSLLQLEVLHVLITDDLTAKKILSAK